MPSPLLRRPVPAPYFHPLFLIFEIPFPLPGEVIETYRTMTSISILVIPNNPEMC